MNNCNEPLSKHTKFDYHECYARFMLEELYPKEFVKLEIKDKPDLQMKNGKFGIEVINAEDQEQLKAESLYTDICYHRVRNEENALKCIKECGCKLEGGVLAGKSGKDSFELILKAFNDKLDKFNGKGYSSFEKNYLFIFSSIYADDRMVRKAIKDMQQCQINREQKFYKVFISVPEHFYSLDLDKGTYEMCPIESEFHIRQSNKAHEFVEEHKK